MSRYCPNQEREDVKTIPPWDSSNRRTARTCSNQLCSFPFLLFSTPLFCFVTCLTNFMWRLEELWSQCSIASFSAFVLLSFSLTVDCFICVFAVIQNLVPWKFVFMKASDIPPFPMNLLLILKNFWVLILSWQPMMCSKWICRMILIDMKGIDALWDTRRGNFLNTCKQLVSKRITLSGNSCF